VSHPVFTLSCEQREGATSTEDVVHAEMHFLKREEKWKTEKPYRFRYRVPQDVARTNVAFEVCNIDIYDMRRFLPSLDLFSNGFEVVSFQTQMQNADWSDPNRISSRYLPELQSFLVRKLGAKHVKLLDYEVTSPKPSLKEKCLMSNSSERDTLPFPSQPAGTINMLNQTPLLILVSQ
jgi:hypothetical protein